MKWVFFDLDETLFDHKHACRKGIESIMDVHPELQAKTSEQLESEFWSMLNGNYHHVLNGTLSMSDARMERICSLFTGCDVAPPDNLEYVTGQYMAAYGRNVRAIPGVADVLRRLKGNQLKIAVITNGFTQTQMKKLESCNILKYIDMVMTSEEAGASKPDEHIFTTALERCGVTNRHTLMIGDSLQNDIMGAHRVGIPTIWLNRRNEQCPEHVDTIEILEPVEILQHIEM